MIVPEHILNVLKQMTPITLSEMESVKLMNRVDSKYMFNSQALIEILNACINDYSVVMIENKTYSTYSTLYYDTRSYDLYHQHHSGKLNRYKIRKRTYVESNLHYLEIKFKSNKGRTTKNRIKLKTNNINEAPEFIEKETNIKIDQLIPSVEIAYNRITLVNKNYPERITIDVNLTLTKDTVNRSFPNLIIAEVKQDKLAKSKFVDLMNELRIKEGAVSKYCLGVSNLVNEVKKNNFKENNQRINKLMHT